jgi:hypothetical protein
MIMKVKNQRPQPKGAVEPVKKNSFIYIHIFMPAYIDNCTLTCHTVHINASPIWLITPPRSPTICKVIMKLKNQRPETKGAVQRVKNIIYIYIYTHTHLYASLSLGLNRQLYTSLSHRHNICLCYISDGQVNKSCNDNDKQVSYNLASLF